MKSWSELARPVIAKILEDTEGQDPKERRKALRDGYPFGERKYWPYKAWLKEIKRQTGKRGKPQADTEAPLFDDADADSPAEPANAAEAALKTDHR